MIDMDWKLILYVLGPVVVLIAAMMELYKKKIRKDKSTVWEIRIVAGVVSYGLSWICYISFNLPGQPLAVLYYGLGVFIAQCYVDMRIIKLIVRAWLKRKGVVDGFEWNE
jgi:hypothetical protein